MPDLTPLSPSKLARTDYEAAHTGYFGRLARAFDVFCNVIFGGLQDETISARMGRWATEDTGVRKWIGTLLAKGLNVVDADHCAAAEESDKERAEVVISTETLAETKL